MSWEYSLVVDCISSMCETENPILSTTKKNVLNRLLGGDGPVDIGDPREEVGHCFECNAWLQIHSSLSYSCLK